jgi:pyruvate/2-oxoglutarate dehydrogenase complex dihydrolipoamide dehydrogenase (E3) component
LLNTEATPELIAREAPDALILAVGSEAIRPNVPGVEGKNVARAADADAGRFAPGKRVVLVGAGLTGLETAAALHDAGHEVTVIDMLTAREIAARDPAVRTLQGMLAQRGVQVLEQTTLRAITERAVLAEDKDGARVELPCESVLLSLGVRPRAETLARLSGLCPDTYIVGDCANRTGNIASAVREGFYAAMNL